MKGSQPGQNMRKPRWNLDDLVPIDKNFYVEKQSVKMQTDQEVNAYYQAKQITIRGRNIPKPIKTFDEAGFPGI